MHRLMLPLVLLCACPRAPEAVETVRTLPSSDVLEAHCRDAVGEPRVIEPADGVFVAIGYDLANTIVIQTDDGRVVVDAGMSPTRSGPMREALDEVTSGPIRAVIYTHSHIDHVGGASVWVEEGTEVWATDALVPHLYKQYAAFVPAESARGGRQFGRDVPRSAVPCSALGRQVDLDAALSMGFQTPTRTFSGQASLEVGGVAIELVEAHGETHDQLFVWLPEQRVLMPGDNWYRAFPNLYTIRGTSPRPVDDWIDSLDRMRRLQPEVLVPSHTRPVQGEAEVQRALRDYRDGIQWVRDEVVRGANAGIDVDTLAATIGLPPHLAEVPELAELYGQIDWSVRAIYGSELGWFDGQGRDLYPLPPEESARRAVDLAGGPEAVLEEARTGREDDPRWSAHLLGWLEDDGRLDKEVLDPEWSATYAAIAEGVHNTNGRAYLLQGSLERADAATRSEEVDPSDDFVADMPLANLFHVMQTRLMPAEARGVHESVVFRFPDEDATWVVTVREGVAEVVQGEPLPGTPEPVAQVEVEGETWRRIALGEIAPAAAVLTGKLKVEKLGAFKRFMDRFDRRVLGPPPRDP